MQLARDLWSVYHRKLYTTWGFETFDQYISKEVGISKDRAYRLRRIFSVFVMKCNVAPSRLNSLGRSKAELLLPFVDKHNANEWLDKAKKLPYDSLNLALDIEREKKTSSSTRKEPAVELSSKPVKLAETSRRTPEFTERKFYLPDDADSLLTEALGEAQRITRSASDSFNLSCILQHFLAHRLTDEGKDDNRLKWFMRNMERIYGVRLIRVKDTDEAWGVLKDTIESRPDLFSTSENKES